MWPNFGEGENVMSKTGLTATAEPTRAYHFVGDTLRDGRPVPAESNYSNYERIRYV